MADPKTAEFRFGLTGLTTKEDPALLGDGRYRSMFNLEAVQEGTISTRAGRRLIGNAGMSLALAYKIAKLRVFAGEDPTNPALNPRYIGIQSGAGQNLYLTYEYNTFIQVASDINTLAGYPLLRFQLADYGSGATGNIWAFIASELKMLKDRGNVSLVPSEYASELPRWGILPAIGFVIASSAGSGNLDGGAASSPNGSTRYDWRYTYVAKDTGNEGNPSQVMIDANGVASGGVACHLASINVNVWNTDDPQIGFIRIYRRGGILFDDWRLVGQIPNAGTVSQNTSFVDNVADADLVFNQLLEVDNDPPVVSAAPSPLIGTLAAPVTYIPTNVPSTGFLPAGFSAVTPGSLLHVMDPLYPEDVVLFASGGGLAAIFQADHDAGTPIEVDAFTGQPCSLAMNYSPQNAVVVAGDPNNPHILYMSKSGNPEAFPVLPADGSIKQIGAGTPSNGIVNLFEFRGQIVTLNRSSIFETLALQGSLIAPAEVAKKGLLSREACCKTDTEIWFLTPNEGIWSWDGSTCRKRSEAIDTIFHGQEFNGVPPMSYDPDALSRAVMVCHRGQIQFTYSDINGNTQLLICEPAFNDRWRAYQEFSNGPTIIYTEEDTGSTVYARLEPVSSPAFSIDDQERVIGGADYTSDNFTNVPNDGVPIPFDMRLPWVDLGTPQVQKLFEEIYLELDNSNNDTGGVNANLTVDLLADYSETPVDSFSVSLIPQGRHLVSLLPDLGLVPPQSFGREVRALSYHFHGDAFPARIQFFKLVMRYQETGLLTGGATTDWMDLGSKKDKRLYQMTVVFDTAGIDRQIVLEGLGGRDGNTSTTSQVFTLSNPVIMGAGRCMKVFPLAAPTILKLARVRAYSTTPDTSSAARQFFKILEVTFPDMEVYPADVVNVTPWENGGSEYLKYINQVTLEVNTNGVPVNFQLQADGSNIGPVLTVTSTESDRQRNVTLPSGLTGYRWRIFVDLTQAALTSGTGMWQLFSHSFKLQPADEGEVKHTLDWDTLGYDYDKLLYTVDISWDNTGGTPVIMELDVIGGINGQTEVDGLQQFTLSGGRGRRVFPISPDTVAKMIRLHPAGIMPPTFKEWKYTFQVEQYPPDVVCYSPWFDGGYEYDKWLNQIDLEVDTGNQPINVIVQVDGLIGPTFSVQTTMSDRRRNLTLPSTALRGKKWRIFVDPTQTPIVNGAGKFQLFMPIGYKFQKADEGEVVHTMDWDTLGYDFDKMLYTVVVSWDNTGGTTVTLQLDTINGINGQTENDNVQQFSLSGGRSRKEFAITPDTIAKMIRLHPVGTVPPTFREWKYAFQSEQLPPDVVVFTPWFDGGGEYDKYLNQVDLEVDTENQPINVQVQADGATVFTFSVQTTFADRRRNVTMPSSLIGKKWRLLIDPTQVPLVFGTGKFQLWQPVGYKFQPADEGVVAHSLDWDTLGYDYDKVLYTIDISWDNTGGAPVTFQLDIINGINGQTEIDNVEQFVLSGGRSRKVFAISPDTIAKMIRVHPVGDVPVTFKEWKYIVQSEQYPPDVVVYSPWFDGGYEYDKYCNQIDLEVDTGGHPINVQLQADGTTVYTFSVLTDTADRRRNIAVPSGLVGKKWRILVDPTQTDLVSGNAKFQLFLPIGYKFQKADRGEVIHTEDWNSLGHPFDKYLQEVVIEWDNTGAAPVTMVMDTIGGVDGQTYTAAVASFVLSGGRSKKTFPLQPDTIAKMVRIYPQIGALPVTFKSWSYDVKKIDYPADIILSTEWRDATTPADKNPTWLYIDADTNGVAAQFDLHNETGLVLTVEHTGTQTDRKRNYAIQADVFAKMWRGIITPGIGGRFQLFSWGFERWVPVDEGGPSDPQEHLIWTPWQNWGWPYETIARNLILTIDSGGVTCRVNLQTGEAGTVASFFITTSYTNRKVVVSCPPNLIGKSWRLLLTEGVVRGGGLSKLWNWMLDVVKEPPSVNQFSSYMQDFGVPFYKVIKEVWIEYTSTGPVTFLVNSETGEFAITFPAHPTRSAEDFYFPSSWPPGLNKSRTYSITVFCANPADTFKMYGGSWLEWFPTTDRHQSYNHLNLSELMQMSI